MKRKLTVSVLITAILILAVTAEAILIPAADKAKENAKANNAPAIDAAGEHWVLSPPGLEKVMFIHYKKGLAKPPAAGKPGAKCYAFLGKEVKWKTTPVNYVIDPDNIDNLTENFVVSAIVNGAEEWDYWTSKELFGSYAVDYNSSWDSNAPDGRNELLFGNYPEANVIAVTVVWGYFSGAPSTRRIVEFDVLFDNDYAWGDATVDSTKMDLQNIATHELGHGVGLADLYDSVCSEETMYGYSNYGETTKRTLNTGDIKGLQAMYG